MRQFLVGAILAVVFVFVIACEKSENTERIEGEVQQRSEQFERASALFPIVPNENYPIREALTKYSSRMDEVNHPWYIYVLGDQGNIIGYYIGQTAPQSTCNFLSSTQDIASPDSEGNVILQAPSNDGIYYSGSGASSSCAMSFFFDLETDALVMVPSIRLFVTDAPLRVDADPITVQIQ